MQATRGVSTCHYVHFTLNMLNVRSVGAPNHSLPILLNKCSRNLSYPIAFLFRLSVWLAQLVRALAAPTHVRSCVQEVRVRSPLALTFSTIDVKNVFPDCQKRFLFNVFNVLYLFRKNAFFNVFIIVLNVFNIYD